MTNELFQDWDSISQLAGSSGGAEVELYVLLTALPHLTVHDRVSADCQLKTFFRLMEMPRVPTV